MRTTYFTKWFWILTFLKIIAASLFASHYVTKGFLPFIQYFLTTGHNPYDYFFQHATIVFPYPAAMLFVMSIFLGIGHQISATLFTHFSISLLLFRIPIFFADIAIYYILCKLLPSKENKVLMLYYASPILFYINYFHGQLDVIPTAFLMISLYLFYLRKYFQAFILLGIGIATKTHLFIALPFYILYLIRQKKSWVHISVFTITTLAIFILCNLPFASKSYISTVFNNVEQQRLFLTIFAYYYKELSVLIAPAALLICFYFFASTKRLNFDSLILTLGLVFTILIALVPPMQGWFYWSIPLLTYFLIKYKDAHALSFLMTNIFYIVFFIFIKDADIFESIGATFPYFLMLPNPYHFLASHGFNALLMQNILFTCLQVSVAMNAYWCYRLGIYHNNLYIDKQQPFILGIGGDSGVGKSTLSENIKSLVGKNQTVILNGDDSHKWERNHAQWQYFTHLNPKANNLHQDVNQIYALIDGKTIERALYNHKTGKFTKPHKIEKDQFIIFQGLHPFFVEKMRSIYHLKIFISVEEKLRKSWKLGRDTTDRGQTARSVREQIVKRKNDGIKYILPQKKLADWVIYYFKKEGELAVQYTMSNSLPIDDVVGQLSAVTSLHISHTYPNTKLQEITMSGNISQYQIAQVAYLLYPNLNELVNEAPSFKNNIEGLNQLFFIAFLNNYFLNAKIKNSNSK